MEYYSAIKMNKILPFVEVLLKNEKLTKNKKEKKSKEFSNGSLEEKPVINEQDEDVIITEERSMCSNDREECVLCRRNYNGIGGNHHICTTDNCADDQA